MTVGLALKLFRQGYVVILDADRGPKVKRDKKRDLIKRSKIK